MKVHQKLNEMACNIFQIGNIFFIRNWKHGLFIRIHEKTIDWHLNLWFPVLCVCAREAFSPLIFSHKSPNSNTRKNFFSFFPSVLRKWGLYVLLCTHDLRNKCIYVNVSALLNKSLPPSNGLTRFMNVWQPMAMTPFCRIKYLFTEN